MKVHIIHSRSITSHSSYFLCKNVIGVQKHNDNPYLVNCSLMTIDNIVLTFVFSFKTDDAARTEPFLFMCFYLMCIIFLVRMSNNSKLRVFIACFSLNAGKIFQYEDANFSYQLMRTDQLHFFTAWEFFLRSWLEMV